ncbi:MAG: hypothetical protein WBC97_10530 [Gemmatimonadales bacterium]
MLCHQHLVGLGRRVAAGALLALALGSGRADAQSGETVAALEQFRDSIVAVSDTESLRRLQHDLDRARDTSTLGLLRRGILALRLGSLPDIERAGDRCAAAERQVPTWPYPPFCRGLAKEAYGSATAANHLNLGLMAGQGDLRSAADQYLVAIRRDPGFAPAIFSLGQLVLRWRGVERQAEALQALRAAVPLNIGTPARLLIIRARLERLAGMYDSSLAAFRAYDSAGGDHAIALLEEARTLLSQGDSTGDSLYYVGAALPDPEASGGYRDDLLLLVPANELGGFDSLTGKDRAGWLLRFWKARDLIDLQPAGSRLREHYRRWLYAIQHFARLGDRRPIPFWCYPDQDYDSHRADMDDRGVIWVRHGPPEMRITTPTHFDYPAESWRYLLAGPDTLVLHFYDMHVTGDYRLVPSAFQLETPPGCIPQNHDTLAMMELRAAMLPDYNRFLTATPMFGARLITQDIARGEVAIPRATSTDENPVSFVHPLEINGRARMFGRAGNDGLLHLVLAARLHEDDTLGARAPQIRIGGYVAGTQAMGWSGSATTSRTVIVNGARWWIGLVTLPLPDGHAAVHAAVDLGRGTGGVSGWVNLDLPPPVAGLSLDGPVLAPTGSALPWVSEDGDSAFFSPWTDPRRDEPVELTAAVRGAIPADTLTITLSVQPRRRSLMSRLFGPRPLGVTIEWSEVATATDVGIHRTLGLSALDPGGYRVKLTVRATRGGSAEREVALTILPGTAGGSVR